MDRDGLRAQLLVGGSFLADAQLQIALQHLAVIAINAFISWWISRRRRRRIPHRD